MIIIISVLQILHMVIGLYIWIVIASSLLSWVNPDPHNPVVQVIRRLTDPAYVFIRKYIPSTFNGIDLTPIILLLTLQVLNNIIAGVILNG